MNAAALATEGQVEDFDKGELLFYFGSGVALLDDTLQRVFERPSIVVPGPEGPFTGWDLYDPVSRMPLDADMYPGLLALQEGRVDSRAYLYAPEGRPERVLLVDAWSLYRHGEEDPYAVGMLVRPDRSGLQRVGVAPRIHLCPCEQWQVEIPRSTPAEWIAETILEHRRECIVLAATALNALNT